MRRGPSTSPGTLRSGPARRASIDEANPLRRFGVFVALGAALLGMPACGPESDAPPQRARTGAEREETASFARPRGLWVLCQGSQRALDRPERIPALIADARALGASDLFVQVYRGGRAWFDSTQADAGPFQSNRAAQGRDTLADLIAAAHAADLRVHAWVNVLSLSNNPEAPLLRDLGREAVLVDQFGRSLLDYPEYEVPQPDRRYYRMGTPGLYLDPADPRVVERLVATLGELLERYPQLDGLHLDYIRYPDVLPFAPGSRFGVGLDFGHSDASRARFERETGLAAPRPPDRLDHAGRWDEWKRDRVTEVVRALRAAQRTAAPQAQLSAAVWAHEERAYLSIGQDWRRWLEEDLLDFAVPMAYSRDARSLRYMAESFGGLPLAQRIWLGLGTWLFAEEPEGALAQIETVRASGVAGDALFSWDSIADAPRLRAALVERVAAEQP